MLGLLNPAAHREPLHANEGSYAHTRLRWQVFMGKFVVYAGYCVVRKNCSSGGSLFALLLLNGWFQGMGWSSSRWIITGIYLMDIPQSQGLPSIEEDGTAYPKSLAYSSDDEIELSAKETFFIYVLSIEPSRIIAVANAFVSPVRHGALDRASTFRSELKALTEVGIMPCTNGQEFLARLFVVGCRTLPSRRRVPQRRLFICCLP